MLDHPQNVRLNYVVQPLTPDGKKILFCIQNACQCSRTRNSYWSEFGLEFFAFRAVKSVFLLKVSKQANERFAYFALNEKCGFKFSYCFRLSLDLLYVFNSETVLYITAIGSSEVQLRESCISDHHKFRILLAHLSTSPLLNALFTQHM